jgi:Fic family protein
MRDFNYKLHGKSLYTSDIVKLLTKIHEYKGKQLLYIEATPDILDRLLDIARIQSIVSSNRIEGIKTEDKRINQLLKQKSMPKNRNEIEIIGYQNVLSTIHDNYEHIPITTGVILQLHRDMYSQTGKNFAGKFKDVDNLIEEEDQQGNKFIRFTPSSAFETPELMQKLCKEFNDIVALDSIEPLLAVLMFILDFLCIHPFNDGNGRMSRLLTLLLLYRNDYLVGKYISIEKLIEDNKERYYDSLRESSELWHNEKNEYKPFVYYMLQIILKAYQEFEERVSLVEKKSTSYERIQSIFDNNIGKITKSDIKEKCPDLSQTTIELALSKLLKNSHIKKIGSGRYTSYIKDI